MYSSFDQAYDAFTLTQIKKHYLVQKSIPLLRHSGKPFDVRVMVQRNPAQEWEVTGIVGRVAVPGKIVTNYHNGGKPMPMQELLQDHMSKAELAAFEERLKKLSIRISNHLHRSFPDFRSFGVDVGIDVDLKPWIIEVNSRPDKYIFRALADKRMFRKIIRYDRLNKTLSNISS